MKKKIKDIEQKVESSIKGFNDNSNSMQVCKDYINKYCIYKGIDNLINQEIGI